MSAPKGNKMKLSDIKPNPNNPRIIKDDKFRKLVKSIEEFPAMMALRPMVINSDNIVLGGNMRLKALKELGYKDISDEWVKRAEDITEDEQRRFIIADNVGFGEHDWEMLANEWDADELEYWGLEMPIDVSSVELDDLGLMDNAFSEEANKLSFSITFNFPISEKEAFDKFDKSELETIIKNFVYA